MKMMNEAAGMRFDIMTLFPNEVDAFLMTSIIGRARSSGLIMVYCHDIRVYTEDKHNRVDDYAYGGGKGMVMQAQPIVDCFEKIKTEVPDTYCVYLSPKGVRFTQNKAKKLLKKKHITLLCGHYEGVDQRAIDLIVDEEISVGDFVLTGGELPAMVVVDTVSRMVDGVLADASCYEDESIYSGLLEYPQYTRPPVYKGFEVPEVLQNGNHALITEWRHTQSLAVTKERRRDLFRQYMKRKSVRDELKKEAKKAAKKEAAARRKEKHK